MEHEIKKSAAAEREEKVLEFWQKENIFQKSLEKKSPNGEYVFYDGPPFATGLPHYGHILGSTAKDAIGRYQTMQGFHVSRRWGWDCHGLPIENIVEKDLGISGHKEIEAYGVGKFTEYARSKVLTYVHEWKKTVDRIGRWVNFDGGYKTMDNTFIESVWWALKELSQKGLLYEGVRVLAYCPRCETPIANSEIAMDNSYKDITDISVYVKFELVDEPGTYLLAWTTTPWTLPGNTAIAINTDIEYVKVKVGDDTFIMSEASVPNVLKDKEYTILEKVSGKSIVGRSYMPPFDYFRDAEMPNKENIWKVWHADFVNTEKGTGIAHEAPAFGEDDMNLAKENSIPWIIHVTREGKFTDEVTDFAGMLVKPKSDDEKTRLSADIAVLKYLQDTGSYFAKEKIVHPYPHCHRCDTPLLYYALPSWFVNIQKVKSDILAQAETMEWVPSYLKDGRFKNILEGAPDWTISRNRYWATPLPFYKSPSGKVLTIGSLDELKEKIKKSGNTYFAMRHGYGQHMEHGVVSSLDHDSYHLTEAGHSGVAHSADKLKGKGITKIFASPLLRTKETAKIVAKHLGLDPESIIIDDRLREYDFGSWDGKNWKDFVKYRDAHLHSYTDTLGGSSLLETKKRFGEFMYDIEATHSNETILIVTHGIFFETVPAVLEGADNTRSFEILFNEFKNYRIQPAEVREISFIPIPHNENYELDFHRPYIDDITLVHDGEDYTRVSEVIDCWFESGSMPFAQDHYPFERPNWHKENFPAGFVAEYIAQTRTWFYYTHVLSTILFGAAPFRHVVTTGTLQAEDGQKMSKSKNNFPDPWILFDKFGVDALRFYLMSSPLMKGEDSNFSEKSVAEVASKIVSRLDNVLTFYELYRDTSIETDSGTISDNVLDIWIISRLNQLIGEVTAGMETYDMVAATRPVELFIEDLSTWYLRRSRDRIKDNDTQAKQTLYTVLKTVAKIIAPVTPFTAEDIWLRLKNDTDVESVHLTNWPVPTKMDEEVISDMYLARLVVSLGLEKRQKSNLKIKQPLKKMKIRISKNLPEKYFDLIKEELNIKEIEFEHVTGLTVIEVELDTVITPELKHEGDYRELVRAVQDMRKKEGLTPSDVITLTLPTSAEEIVTGFEDDMKKTVLAEEIVFSGEEIKVEK